MRADVLVVDDREKLCVSLLTSFQERGFTGVYARNRTEALNQLFAHEIGVVVLDVKLGGESGLDVLSEIQKLKQEIPVIMITGHATVNMAVQALKSGAMDFLEKPVPFPRLFEVFQRAVALKKVSDGARTRYRRRPTKPRDKFVTADSRLVQLLLDAGDLAKSDLPILIQGESGTGKELVADFIHSCSFRADSQLMKINCSAFPETLLDNELFGHEKGAFTGATTLHQGVFERADGGSLFLDELGDMPAYLQPRVLRAVQNGEIRRLGGSKDLVIDVRFIAATNQDLEQMVSEGNFREDLYYRLNAARIELPPLRERAGDIPLLVNHFIDECNEGTGAELTLAKEVMEVFVDYDWPGNIRELQNAVRYGAALARNGQIGLHCLPPHLKPSSIRKIDSQSRSPIEIRERRVIQEALENVSYNKKRAAELLQISRVTLYSKIEKYGIVAPTEPR